MSFRKAVEALVQYYEPALYHYDLCLGTPEPAELEDRQSTLRKHQGQFAPLISAVYQAVTTDLPAESVHRHVTALREITGHLYRRQPADPEVTDRVRYELNGLIMLATLPAASPSPKDSTRPSTPGNQKKSDPRGKFAYDLLADDNLTQESALRKFKQRAAEKGWARVGTVNGLKKIAKTWREKYAPKKPEIPRRPQGG
jgi:hypothetical protein